MIFLKKFISLGCCLSYVKYIVNELIIESNDPGKFHSVIPTNDINISVLAIAIPPNTLNFNKRSNPFFLLLDRLILLPLILPLLFY